MFKFAEIEKEEHEKKVLRDCRTLAAKKPVAEFASELDRIIEPMRIYFPNAEVRLGKSGLDVTLDLKYRSPPSSGHCSLAIAASNPGAQ